LHRFLDAAFSGAVDPHLASSFPRHELPIDVTELHWEGNATLGGGRRVAMPSSLGGNAISLRVIRPDASGVAGSDGEGEGGGVVFTCISEAGLSVQAAPLNHSVPCLGYVVTEEAPVNLNPEKLLSFGIRPGRDTRDLMMALKEGRSVQVPAAEASGGRPGETRTVTPGDVMGGDDEEEGRGGRKVAMFSDCSSPSPSLIAIARGADLLVHEATLLPGEEEKAVRRGHSTPKMAGAVAAAVEARALLLTHFGRAHLEKDMLSSMWALGLREARAAWRKTGGEIFGGGAAAAAAGGSGGGGGSVRGGGGGGVEPLSPHFPPTVTRWASVYASVSGALESKALHQLSLDGSLLKNGGICGGGESIAASGAFHSQSAAVDFSYPRVMDAPEPSEFEAAAGEAYRANAHPSLPKTLPVLCSRDFLRVIVQPSNGRKWGLCGPLR